jgi:hypothetical protein
MSKKPALFAIVLLVIGFFLVAIASAQVPMPTGIECVPVPGIPCPGSRTGSSSSSHSGSVNSMMQQELVGALAESFFKMLLSSDSKATAQKQQMMEELERRKAEAERQHKVEEAKRLEAICNRLEASLKLSGVPSLRLKKDEGATGGGLRLKLGDDSGTAGRAHTLPGIALNDTTGNGGNTPYGIKGLPGIYLNGSGSGSGSAAATESKLQLKTGDELEPVTPVPVADDPIATSPSAVPADEVVDVQDMTPQQLADVATRVNNLPPEEQQRLMAVAQRNTQVEAGSSKQPVASQLQQMANASQSAATSQSLEGATAQARVGFDQAIGGGSVPAPTASSAAPSQTALPGSALDRIQAVPTDSSNPTPSPMPARSAHSPVQVSGIDLGKSEPDKPMAVQQLSTGTPGRAPGCPIASTRKLPTREELAQELAGLRFRLDVLKNSLLRLNRSLQMDQGQFSEWEKETQDAVDRSDERLRKAIADRIEGRFFDYAEGYYDQSPEKLKALKQVEVLIKEADVHDWADKGEKTWDQVGEGLALLGDTLPISKGSKDILWASKNTIDSAFDIATELAAWQRISQLQKNSDAYLVAVKQSGEQMKQIVGRIRDVEDRLASGSYATEHGSHQSRGAGCESGE